MKKLISILISISILSALLTIQYASPAAESLNKPSIRLELSDYKSQNERGFFSTDTIRYGREKTSAKAGERVTLTFILSGMDKLEYFQLSGSFDKELLSPAFYSADVWVTGESDQDFHTVVDDCSSFGTVGIDCSYSFTRTDYDPMLYACGYSLDGSIPLKRQMVFDSGYAVEGTPLVSFGFDVLGDIDNIYSVFSWDVSGTTLSESLDGEEYSLDNMLTIACPHQYQASSVSGDCSYEGYTLYRCVLCNDEFKTDIVPAGHFFEVNGAAVKNRFSYTCTRCGAADSKMRSELKAIWNDVYINKTPRTTAFDKSCYLDVVADKTINAKDFGVIGKE